MKLDENEEHAADAPQPRVLMARPPSNGALPRQVPGSFIGSTWSNIQKQQTKRWQLPGWHGLHGILTSFHQLAPLHALCAVLCTAIACHHQAQGQQRWIRGLSKSALTMDSSRVSEMAADKARARTEPTPPWREPRACAPCQAGMSRLSGDQRP